MRYVYNISDGKIICVSHFAGKAVRGIAKCDISCDEFVEDTGKELARRRCDVKVTSKRVKRARAKMLEAQFALQEATTRLAKMSRYFEDATNDYNAAMKELSTLEKSLR